MGKIRLLDVGSCFNPFKKFDEFLTVGIDIVPAVEVRACRYCCCFFFSSIKHQNAFHLVFPGASFEVTRPRMKIQK